MEGPGLYLYHTQSADGCFQKHGSGYRKTGWEVSRVEEAGGERQAGTLPGTNNREKIGSKHAWEGDGGAHW